MLEWLDVKGHMIMIDAMGCQHAIAPQILKKEGVYIFSLKGNRETLHLDIIFVIFLSCVLRGFQHRISPRFVGRSLGRWFRNLL
jgi:predicted transposase YbfD/YdcC